MPDIAVMGAGVGGPAWTARHAHRREAFTFVVVSPNASTTGRGFKTVDDPKACY